MFRKNFFTHQPNRRTFYPKKVTCRSFLVTIMFQGLCEFSGGVILSNFRIHQSQLIISYLSFFWEKNMMPNMWFLLGFRIQTLSQSFMWWPSNGGQCFISCPPETENWHQSQLMNVSLPISEISKTPFHLMDSKQHLTNRFSRFFVWGVAELGLNIVDNEGQ